MITRISSVIRPKGSDLIFDHPYNDGYLRGRMATQITFRDWLRRSLSSAGEDATGRTVPPRSCGPSKLDPARGRGGRSRCPHGTADPGSEPGGANCHQSSGQLSACMWIAG